MKEDARGHNHHTPLPCCGSSGGGTPEPGTPDTAVSPDHTAEALFRVSGMQCGACAARIHDALTKTEGVLHAQVSLREATAWVRYDPRCIHRGDLGAALAAAGYPAEESPRETRERSGDQRPASHRRMVWAAAAAVGVVGFYLGLITLTSNWSNAVYQFGEYGGWVLALALGLGVQVGLFVHMRAALAGARLKGAASGMAASGGMSGVAMALCCSHYLAAVLPAIGLPFFSGALAGLVEYQTAFFVVGVVSNFLGIAYMVRLMLKSGLIHRAGTYA